MQRRGHGEHFRAGAIDAVRVQTAAVGQRRMGEKRVLAVRGDDVQVELGLGIVPAEHHTDLRRGAQVVRFIELHALERLALGTAHFDTVGTGAKRIRPGETPVIVGIQIQWIAVDRQRVRPALIADGLELALNHRAIALNAAINRRRGIGDLRVFTAIKQAVITPATGRF